MQTELPIKNHLQSLEEQLLRPEVRTSPACVAALLADGFVEFGSSGRVFSREESVKGLLKDSGIRWSLSDFNALQLTPDVVLVTYRAARHDDVSGSPAHSLRSSLWKLTDGRWQIVFHQGTPSKGDQ